MTKHTKIKKVPLKAYRKKNGEEYGYTTPC